LREVFIEDFVGGKDYGCAFCTWRGLITQSSVDLVLPEGRNGMN